MCESWAYDFDNHPFNFFFPKKKIFSQILYKFFPGTRPSLFLHIHGMHGHSLLSFCCCQGNPQFSTQGLHSSFLIALRSFICAMNKKCIHGPDSVQNISEGRDEAKGRDVHRERSKRDKRKGKRNVLWCFIFMT